MADFVRVVELATLAGSATAQRALLLEAPMHSATLADFVVDRTQAVACDLQGTCLAELQAGRVFVRAAGS